MFLHSSSRETQNDSMTSEDIPPPGQNSQPADARAVRFPEERVKAVDKAIKFWIQQLVDPSRRNNLLFYRDTLTTTLPLDAADVPSVNRLLEGRPVLLDEFVNSALKEEEQEEQLKDLRKRATVIYRIAQRNDEEAGLETLYLAIGFATWDIGGGTTDRPPASPVLLMPIGMRPRGQGSLRSFTLEPLGEVVVNPVLLHSLAALGVQVDEATLLSGIEGLEDRDPGMKSPDDAHQVFERLTAADVPPGTVPLPMLDLEPPVALEVGAS